EPRAMGRTALDFTAAEGAGSQRHPRILLASRTVHAEGQSGRIAIAYLPVQPAASAKVVAVTWVEPWFPAIVWACWPAFLRVLPFDSRHGRGEPFCSSW